MNLSDLTLFALSLVALALGPVAYGAARVAGHMMAALDGFVFVAITGLVVLHIVPESVALAGWLAVLGVAVGIWLPTLIEHRLRSLARRVHNVTLIFGLMAIAVHAFTDGLALGSDSGAQGQAHMLPMAVVLHRMPVGLTIWFLLRPLYGLRAAMAALALMALATTAGFFFGGAVLPTLESRVWGLFQALVAGSLLHVVLHRSYPVTAGSTSPSTRRWQSGLGAVAGLLLLTVTTAGHDLGVSMNTGIGVFYVLARESAPALLLAYVAAGLVHGLMPQATVAWMGRGSSLSQAARGMGFGLPLPVCSCGVVPIYRSLIVAGVPATAAMAFLVATPELSLYAILISLPLLGGEFTIVRVAAAATVALFTGWIVGPLARTLIPLRSSQQQQQTVQPFAQRVRQGLAQGLGEIVDTTAPWILVGLALAAGAHSLVGGRWDAVVPANFEVEFFALLGMPIYVCASGATPLVAVLIHNGVSPGAALAFLLTGPATNLTTLGVLTRLH
ncbi:MAG: permease, partial [bacterium]|nr:permease [bacterium]